MDRHRPARGQHALSPGNARKAAPALRVLLGAVQRLLVAGLGALAAAFAIWIVINMPEMAAHQAQSRRVQAAVLAGENRRLCQGWGLRPESVEFRNCISDIARVRDEERARAASEMSVF